MSKPLRLSDLSPARRTLVRICQTINYGHIENLEVRDSDPILDPSPVMLKDVKLDSDEGPRLELSLTDFVVSGEVLRLMSLLDKMKRGTIRRLDVRAGVPRRMSLTVHGVVEHLRVNLLEMREPRREAAALPPDERLPTVAPQ